MFYSLISHRVLFVLVLFQFSSHSDSTRRCSSLVSNENNDSLHFSRVENGNASEMSKPFTRTKVAAKMKSPKPKKELKEKPNTNAVDTYTAGNEVEKKDRSRANSHIQPKKRRKSS